MPLNFLASNKPHPPDQIAEYQSILRLKTPIPGVLLPQKSAETPGPIHHWTSTQDDHLLNLPRSFALPLCP